MTITALMDNYCSKRGLRAEHGLSLLLETPGAAVLFDAGQGGAFLENARFLGVDLSAVSSVVLSHGHYDHGSGLFPFYESVRGVPPPLYAGRGFDEERFHRTADSFREIGLPKPLLPPGLPPPVVVDAARELAPGLHLLPAAEIRDDVGPDPGFRRVTTAGESRDLFEDELSIAVVDDSGLTVLTGCAHRGILNILAAALSAFPGRPLKAVVGGFHLVNAPEKELARAAAALAELEPASVHCSHCTGLRGFAALDKAMPGRVSWLACGTRITV